MAPLPALASATPFSSSFLLRGAPLAIASDHSTSSLCSSPLRIEAAHHVNKKATGKHQKNRPKKSSPSDIKRGGTKDYGPLPERPPFLQLDPEAVQAQALAAAAAPTSS
eukprot:TRINITY_DN691_c0_g1_i1.p1 TRINITY_DN691_c0_g1~~TRINITY_DN691_c0_g1_i1.p1  ORF type:complete len:124 (+),score=25.18 TRINITY_DN691_c0_g1_i1:47-373(+)